MNSLLHTRSNPTDHWCRILAGLYLVLSLSLFTEAVEALPVVVGGGPGGGDVAQDDDNGGGFKPPTGGDIGDGDQVAGDNSSPFPTHCGFGIVGVPGIGGTVFTDFGPGDDWVRAVAVQWWDGKIVVVGSSDGDFAVARYFASGAVDTSFGLDNGVTVHGIVPGDIYADVPSAIAIQPDGKILLAGGTMRGTYSDMALARYLEDGTLDEGNCPDVVFQLPPDIDDPHAPGVPFMRGDVDDNGAVNLSDVIVTLEWTFLGNREIACLDTADTTDDGLVTINDPIRVLVFPYLGGDAPAAPFDACSLDRTGDALSCEFYRSCPITSVTDF